VAWSLAGMKDILKAVSVESLQYHSRQEDLAFWAATSLGDGALAEKISRSKKLKGERLRESLIKAVDSALEGAR